MERRDLGALGLRSNPWWRHEPHTLPDRMCQIAGSCLSVLGCRRSRVAVAFCFQCPCLRMQMLIHFGQGRKMCVWVRAHGIAWRGMGACRRAAHDGGGDNHQRMERLQARLAPASPAACHRLTSWSSVLQRTPRDPALAIGCDRRHTAAKPYVPAQHVSSNRTRCVQPCRSACMH